KSGTIRWDFREYSGAWAGVFSTAGGLVFAGDGQGNFIALDADTGEDLWHVPLGAPIRAAAISYAVNGRQFPTLSAGGAVVTFASRTGAGGGRARINVPVPCGRVIASGLGVREPPRD